MIWKIFFVLVTLLFLFLQTGGIVSTFKLSEFSISAGYILSLFFVFISGFFYSLGWKKRLYSYKAAKGIFAFLVLFLISITILAILSGLDMIAFHLKVSGQTDMMPYLMRLIFVVALVYITMSLPVIFAFFKYKKHYDTLCCVEKPYWKMFLLYFSLTSFVNNVYAIFAKGISIYNVWDYIAICMPIIGFFYTVGFAFNIKFGKQILWKVLFIPYVLFLVAEIFLCSDDYLTMVGLQTTKISYSGLVAYALILVTFAYACYRYALKDDVYKKIEANT